MSESAQSDALESKKDFIETMTTGEGMQLFDCQPR